MYEQSKNHGRAHKEPPKPVNKAEIKGQGSIPYATLVEEPLRIRCLLRSPPARSEAWAQRKEAVATLAVKYLISCDKDARISDIVGY